MPRPIHYPWRCSLPQDRWADLPVPRAGHAAPGLGAFIVIGRDELEELPGPTIREGAGRLWCRAGGEDIFFDPSAVYEFQRLDVTDLPRHVHFALTDAFIHLAAFLYEDVRRNEGAFADMPLSLACRRFRSYLHSDHDFATETLVVDIARNCLPVLEGIVTAPRRNLFRQHDEVALDHLQELDEYALRSLAYRPGRTIAMKAGAKQRLTGVVRVESADTYENRVVADFIRRVAVKTDQYVAEMCVRCPEASRCKMPGQAAETGGCCSERVVLVSAFGRKCQSWLRSCASMSVRPLPQPTVRPNYVLQQNPRYALVWRYYQRLLKEEDVEEDVWRWQRRSWADYLRMVMMETWESRLRRRSEVVLSERPFQIKATNDRGAWLCEDPYEEALVLRDELTGGLTTVYLLNAIEAQELLGCPGLKRLNFDFCWVALPPSGPRRIMPVWALYGSPLWSGRDVEAALVSELDALAGWYNDSREFKAAKVVLKSPLVVIPSKRHAIKRGEFGCILSCAPFRPSFGHVANLVREFAS